MLDILTCDEVQNKLLLKKSVNFVHGSKARKSRSLGLWVLGVPFSDSNIKISEHIEREPAEVDTEDPAELSEESGEAEVSTEGKALRLSLCEETCRTGGHPEEGTGVPLRGSYQSSQV